MSEQVYRDFLITMRIKRIDNEEMYDDLASFGPRFRSFRIRSIAHDFYWARRQGLIPSYATVCPLPPTESGTDAAIEPSADDAIASESIYPDIRITMRIRRVDDPEMYDDLASFGPRHRSFRIRSIAHDFYRARRLGLIPSYTAVSSPTPTDADAEIDTSADEAILKAFGNTLGISTSA